MGRSGPQWISYQSAAKKLGCSVEEVEHLVESHLVRSLVDGDLSFVAASDLDELAELRSPPQVDTLRLARSLALAEQRIERLEEAVNLLYESNGLTSFKMGFLEDETLLQLEANIEEMMDQPEWPLPRLLSCAEVYLKLSEVELERLSQLTERPAPWRPFLQLCLQQLVWLSRRPSMLEKWEWARARDLLYQGLKNLRHLALVYCSLDRDPTPLLETAAAVCRDDVENIDQLVLQNRGKTPVLKKPQNPEITGT
jgi:hypothetical protein